MFTHVITTGVFKGLSSLSAGNEDYKPVGSATERQRSDGDNGMKLVSIQGRSPRRPSYRDDRLTNKTQYQQDIRQRDIQACAGRVAQTSSENTSDQSLQPGSANQEGASKPVLRSGRPRPSLRRCPCKVLVGAGQSAMGRRHSLRTISQEVQNSTKMKLDEKCENIQKVTKMEYVPSKAAVGESERLQHSPNQMKYGKIKEKTDSDNVRRASDIDRRKNLVTIKPNIVEVNRPVLARSVPDRFIQKHEMSCVGSPLTINLQEGLNMQRVTCPCTGTNINSKRITNCKLSKIPVFIGNNTRYSSRCECISIDMLNIGQNKRKIKCVCTQRGTNTDLNEYSTQMSHAKAGSVARNVCNSKYTNQSFISSSANDREASELWTLKSTLETLRYSNTALRESAVALEASVSLLKKSTAALQTRMTMEMRNLSTTSAQVLREDNYLILNGNDGLAKSRVTVKKENTKYHEDSKPISITPKIIICPPVTNEIGQLSAACKCNHPMQQVSTNVKKLTVVRTRTNEKTPVMKHSEGDVRGIRRHSNSFYETVKSKDSNSKACHNRTPIPRTRSFHNTDSGDAIVKLSSSFDGTKMNDLQTKWDTMDTIALATAGSREPDEGGQISQADKSNLLFKQLDSTATKIADVKPAYIPLPYLPQKEVNRYKNIHLAQVLIPQIFGLVLHWGCPNKLPDESFMDYLSRIKSNSALSAERLRTEFNINQDDIEKLKNNMDSSELDATLMFPLIQLCCDGLEDRQHPIWHQDNDTRTECLIMKAKKQRNKICHGVRSAAVSSEVFDETKIILMTLIKVSGDFFGQDQCKIQKELNLFVGKIDALALKTEDRRLIDLQHMLHTQGLSESKAYWQEYYTTDAVPFTDNIVQRDKVFHPMEVYVKDITPNKCRRNKISYREILRKSDVDGTRTSIIMGEAGSGKTTVLKNISLQFLGIISNEIKIFNEIHLLLSMECRGRQAKTLKEFIENNFPRTCRKVTADEALKCFSYIGNLIFIDGYDELNECSAQVIREIVHAMKTSMPFCHIVFTTRPHAAIGLESFLKNEGVPFNSYELVKISEEEDQLEFLRRYENALACNANVGGMNEAFKDLKEEVKDFFVYPINLILFYYIYLHSPDAIKQWENFNDVIGQILLLYEMFIERKLNEHSIPNLKYLIRELLGEVNCFALECLAKNKIVLSDLQFQEIRVRCAAKLAAWGLLQVDANVVLSVVFLTKFSPTANSKPAYQFFHRSIQEMMAGRALAKTLQKRKHNPTKEVLQNELGILDRPEVIGSSNKGSFSRFLNVLRFVVIGLTEKDHGQYDLHHLLPILGILEEECTNFEFWAGLVMSCPTSHDVAKASARAYRRTSWIIRTAGEVVLASRLIRHLSLRLLRVALPRSAGLPCALGSLMAGVGEKLQGLLFLELHSSYWNYLPFDESMVHLTYARCGLSEFLGCLGSCRQAVQALVGAVAYGKRVRLDISLSDPGQHHLRELESTRSTLRVRVRVGLQGSVPAARPLPRTLRDSPELTVECSLTTQPHEVVALVVALAPADGRFAGLQLQHWPEADEALQDLLHGLAAAGVQTKGFGSTRWDPALVNTDGDCSVCASRVHGPMERCVELWIL